MIGRRLAHYEILEQLGAGGMGEVYLARDDKLGRQVALKLLPPEMSSDPERLERFQREVRALATLNHPNIVHVYSVEESDGLRFFTMEVVRGASLDKVLPPDGFSREDFFHLAVPLASALSAAHERGVTHRDLKPANILVAEDERRIKIVDFGLAKLVPEQSGPLVSQLPTEAVTTEGRVLGTAPYMSPEQIEGRPVDHRTDVFSVGIVLFEMATGGHPFAAASPPSLVSSILRDDPPSLTEIDRRLPRQLGRIIHRCLEKEPLNRFQSARDLYNELRDLAKEIETDELTRRSTSPGDAAPSGPREPSGRGEPEDGAAPPRPEPGLPGAGRGPTSRLRRAAPWIVAAVATILGAWAIWASRRVGGPPLDGAAAAPVVSRLTIPTEPLLAEGRLPAIAISSDGSRIVYAARGDGRSRLYLREIGSLEAKPIAGTEGAEGPFLSPDGSRVGFVADGHLNTVSIEGGPATPLHPVSVFLGGDWAEDGTIVYGEWPTRHLWRISAKGGSARALTSPLADTRFYIDYAPSFVAGARAVVFNNFNAFTAPGMPLVRLQELDSDEQRVLELAGSNVHYARTGHLVFAHDGSLLAAPFDRERLRLAGAAQAVVAGVLTSVYGAAQYDLSDTGTLVYLPGRIQRPEHRLVWVDRSGASTPITSTIRSFWGPRLSPDGSRIATWISDDTPHVWTYDLVRGGLSRVTSEGANFWSLWTPDSQGLAFAHRTDEGTGYVAFQPADPSAPQTELVGAEVAAIEQPLSWVGDREQLIFQRGSGAGTGFDVWAVSLAAGAAPRPLLRTPANEFQGILSPDGRWFAYVSDELGRREVYVKSFPAATRTVPISTQGGQEPLWSSNGRELFYRSDGKVMVVDVVTEPDFEASRPRVLFDDPFVPGTPYGRNYDIDPSGERFVMIESVTTETTATEIVVVQNWFQDLEELASAD